MQLRAGILTASDRSFQGEREDASGPLLKELFINYGAEVIIYQVVPDDKQIIAGTIKHWADHLECELIFTTGGTGLSPRDQTPDATLEIIEKEIPGIAQALRAKSLEKTPMAMLSRGVAGIRGRTLIINLPGSPSAVRESFEILKPMLAHAAALLGGKVKDCSTHLSSSWEHSS